MKLSARKIAQATGGAIVHGSPEMLFNGVSTDSRTIRPGQLFVPLVGSRYDGHDFITDALQRGASGFLRYRDLKGGGDVLAKHASPLGKGAKGVCILVHDTFQALSALAAWAVRELKAHVVAVAGSNGKTTTKELIARLLALKFRIHATEGNQNTEIGLPLTVLNTPEDTEMLVLEMGATVPGDVKRLCQIAQPQLGVLTSLSEEHTATLGTLREIIETETELLEALPPQGLAIINGDTPEIRDVARRKARCRLMTFGFAPDNDFVAEDAKIWRGGTRFYVKSPEWQNEISVSLLGRPAVLAALAAIAVAQHFGLSFAEIRRGLTSAHSLWGRLQLVPIPDTSITVLHDAYNANPASMHEALLCAAQLRQPDEKLIFVLGDMLELGAISERAHREVGQLVTRPELRPDQLIVVGPWAQLIGDEAANAGISVKYCATADEAAAALVGASESEERQLILLKGSRGMHLEKLLEALSRHMPLPL